MQAISFPSPVITLNYDDNMLAPLHKELLLKTNAMCTFTVIIRSELAELGGIDIGSLEVTTGINAIHHLISLFNSKTPSHVLTTTVLELHQLEVGSESLFLNLLCTKLSILVTST